MARILIADTPKGSVDLERILKGHELTVVNTLGIALASLKENTFDLIVAALHFDESQMFELIREVRNCPRNAAKPIICFCSRRTEMARLMHESLEITTRSLGAWMYLEEHAYNVYQDPDSELRRVIERCLTEEARREILQQRIELQKQRGEIQHLRVLLEAQEWSPAMKDYLAGLKHDLELLMQQVTTLQSSAQVRRASVKSSRDLKDRVSEQVTQNENFMASTEEIQSAAETSQTTEEERVSAKEEIKEAAGRRKLDTLDKH